MGATFCHFLERLVMRYQMMRTSPTVRATAQAAAWAFGLIVSGAQAQTAPAPSAGDVQRSVTPAVQPPVKPADAAPAVTVEKPAVAAVKGPAVRFEVKSLSIEGNTVFATEALFPLVSDVVGQTVTLAELQQVLDRITAHYRNAGYPTARALLPVQEIRAGAIRVLVLEGRIGAVSVNNDSLIKDAQVRRMIGDLPAGAVVQEPDLERRLLLLSETPGATKATVLLKPGAHTGETDLSVDVGPMPRVTGQIDADNHGNRYTGYQRLAALVNINSPLGQGDQLQLRGMWTDENLVNVKLSYRTPVGGTGWTVGAAWSDVHYELGREFAPLQAHGWSRVGTLSAAYPLLRTLDHTLWGTITYDHKSFEDRQDFTDPATIGRKHSDLYSLGLNGYGNLLGATYAWNGVASRGRLNLESAADPSGTAGTFSKLVATGNATWPLSANWSLYGSAYGQLASKNLDSSERLSLGGVMGVRAYPQGESSGGEGYIFSGEVRYTVVPRPLQFAAFVDAGGVRFDKFPLTANNSRFLSGAGLSATWAPRGDMALRVMMASRLGNQKVLSEPDAATRWWLQWVWRF